MKEGECIGERDCRRERERQDYVFSVFLHAVVLNDQGKSILKFHEKYAEIKQVLTSALSDRITSGQLICKDVNADAAEATFFLEL